MYEQIKEHVRQDIYNGKLKHDDLLPSVRQLAKDLNVSMITTKRAYMELEYESLIYTISGKGTFVNAADISKIITERNEKMLSEFKEKVEEIRGAGIDKVNAIDIIEKIYLEGGEV
jgi:GntR family transcriptional regulator